MILFIINLFFGICRAETNKFFEIDKKKFIAVKIKKDLQGNIERGKKIFISRKVNCLSCHAAPIAEEKFHGNFGPSLGDLNLEDILNTDEKDFTEKLSP